MIPIRPATPADVERMLEIYQPHVLSGTATFEEEAVDTAEMRRRFDTVHAARCPWIVAERDGIVVGYAYARPYHARSAYRHTVEDSVYVAPEAAGCGVGRALLGALMARCADAGFRQMIALIGDGANEASKRLHAGLGFREVGVLEEVGFKFGRWLDVVLMQARLGDG